jgi:hypothetical protein
VAGSLTLIDDIRDEFRREGMLDAIARRHTPKIFDWLLTMFSYQGVSDQVARNYIRKHGNASWSNISAGLTREAPCPLLRSYWDFDSCRYDKTNFICSQPDLIHDCPLPKHRLRNGRLNQTGYSFYLFVRDIADGDLVGWIDDRLSQLSADRAAASAQESLIGPLRNVFGVSDKVLTMTLSTLLLGASQNRPAWLEAGKDMIAIDTLVHNFLHRTGVLEECNAEHPYGTRCYAAGSCADIVRAVALQIDASRFNRTFPRVFPRLVQVALWNFCSIDGLDICNGNRIDDRNSCQNNYCVLFSKCARKPLYSL